MRVVGENVIMNENKMSANLQWERNSCPLCLDQGQDQLLYQANIEEKFSPNEVFKARRLPDRLHYRTVRCLRCGMVRGDPILTQKTLAQLYRGADATDSTVANYAALTYGQMWLRHFGNLDRQKPVLEIGCATGAFLSWLKDQGWTDVQGVEPSPAAFKQARDKGLLIHEGMWEEMGDWSNRFYALAAFHVLDHVSQPRTWLSKARESLVAGGRMMVVVHDIDHPIAKMLGAKCPMVDIEHPFLYNKQSLRSIMEETGWKVKVQWDVVNAYPLEYWWHLAPSPKPLKEMIATFLKQSVFGQHVWSLSLGNQGILVEK